MTKLVKNLILIALLLMTINSAYCYNLSSDELNKIIKAKVYKEAWENLSKYSKDIEIKLSNIPFDNVITNENIRPTVEVISQNQNFQPNSVRRIVIKNAKGEIVKSFGLSVNILVFDNVLVAKSLIQYNKEVNNQNTSIERREISKYLGKTIKSDNINLVAKRNFPQGSIITNDYLATKNVILKNSLVDIIFVSDNGLIIKLQGTALKDGSIGDRITVRSDKYNRIYTAVINSQKEVTVRI